MYDDADYDVIETEHEYVAKPSGEIPTHADLVEDGTDYDVIETEYERDATPSASGGLPRHSTAAYARQGCRHGSADDKECRQHGSAGTARHQ